MKRRHPLLGQTALRRVAIGGLFVGHLAWILLGRTPGSRFQGLVDTLSRPGLVVASLWEGWRVERSMQVTTLAQAQTELDALRQQLRDLRTQQAMDAQRLAEADAAGRLLELKKLLPLEFRTVRVMANLRRAPFGGLVLDQGQDAGFAADQGVICPEGVVGRIWAVSGHQASVLPLDAYNASTAVMLGNSRATGILQGTGPCRATIRYINSQEAIQPGEAVYTSGHDRVFPRGLLVGWVLAAQPGDTDMSIDVQLAAPLDRLSLVMILPPAPRLELEVPAQKPGKQP